MDIAKTKEGSRETNLGNSINYFQGGQECPKGQNGKESLFLRSEAGDPMESTVLVSLIKGFYAN